MYTGGAPSAGPPTRCRERERALQLENSAELTFNDDPRVSCNGAGGIWFGVVHGHGHPGGPGQHTISVGSSGLSSGSLQPGATSQCTQLGGRRAETSTWRRGRSSAIYCCRPSREPRSMARSRTAGPRLAAGRWRWHVQWQPRRSPNAWSCEQRRAVVATSSPRPPAS